MTVEEMKAKVAADIEQWCSKIGVVMCRAHTERHRNLSDVQKMRAGLITARMAAFMISEGNWKNQALEVVEEHKMIPESCTSISAMCHAMAHCIADKINAALGLSGESEFRCDNFVMGPHHPDCPTAKDSISERIKFSDN